MVDWIDKAGNEWSFETMSDQHLLNTERFCRRQSDKAMTAAGKIYGMGFGGEMASYYADQAADDAMDASIVFSAKAEEMRAVLKERGLTPLGD